LLLFTVLKTIDFETKLKLKFKIGKQKNKISYELNGKYVFIDFNDNIVVKLSTFEMLWIKIISLGVVEIEITNLTTRNYLKEISLSLIKKCLIYKY